MAVELLPEVRRGHDPFEVGWTFAAGLALMLTIALTLELFSLGLAMAVEFRGSRMAVRILVPTAIACLMIVGAMLGQTFLADASVHTLAGLLSFGCAALLFPGTEELLVEAHESADTVFTTAMFFVGFLIFLPLGMPEQRFAARLTGQVIAVDGGFTTVRPLVTR